MQVILFKSQGNFVNFLFYHKIFITENEIYFNCKNVFQFRFQAISFIFQVKNNFDYLTIKTFVFNIIDNHNRNSISFAFQFNFNIFDFFFVYHILK